MQYRFPILLLIAFLLSHVVLFRFNVYNQLVVHNVWIRILPFYSYAGESSGQMFLTSAVAGYILFAVSGLLVFLRYKDASVRKTAVIMMALAIVPAFFEITSYIQDMKGVFTGKHMHIGWLLLIVGSWLYRKVLVLEKK